MYKSKHLHNVLGYSYTIFLFQLTNTHRIILCILILGMNLIYLKNQLLENHFQCFYRLFQKIRKVNYHKK